jgi:hypothetical protein
MFTTTGIGRWADDISGSGRDDYIKVVLHRGRRALRRAGYEMNSPDAQVLAYLTERAVAQQWHDCGNADEDYLAAGDVLDKYVTDHDAELLSEIGLGLVPEPAVGSMTPEVTAIHTLLLDVANATREKLEQQEESA